MYEILYELSPDKFYFPVDTIMCFFMAIGLFVNGIDQFKKMKASGRGILKKAFHIFWICLGIAGVIVFVPAGIHSIGYGGSDNAFYAEAYDCGEYDIVEGAVDNYYDAGKYISFTVEDVEFSMSRSNHRPSEYRTIKDVKLDRKTVRICYFDNDTYNPGVSNRVLKLELLQE